MTRRTLTLPERRLLTRALVHLLAEYSHAARMREQTGDGRSARMRMLRNVTEAEKLVLLINRAEAIELTIEPRLPRPAFV